MTHSQGSPTAKAVYQDITDYCEEGVWYNDGYGIRYYDPIPDLESCRDKCITAHDAKFFSYCPDHPQGMPDKMVQVQKDKSDAFRGRTEQCRL